MTDWRVNWETGLQLALPPLELWAVLTNNVGLAVVLLGMIVLCHAFIVAVTGWKLLRWGYFFSGLVWVSVFGVMLARV